MTCEPDANKAEQPLFGDNRSRPWEIHLVGGSMGGRVVRRSALGAKFLATVRGRDDGLGFVETYTYVTAAISNDGRGGIAVAEFASRSPAV